MAKTAFVSIDSCGRKKRYCTDGVERPYRWYHQIGNDVSRWWATRNFRRRQAEFKRTDTRYYGDGGTIHHTGYVDVEIAPNGAVAAVWFRCMALPFRMHLVDEKRVKEMAFLYQANKVELCGVETREVKDGN